MNKQPLVSICIPTYKRPQELKRALYSIDTKYINDVDIVISENCSVLQDETRKVVEEFKRDSPFEVIYKEQQENVGYDRNIQTIVQLADGEFIVFLSDDDVFIPNSLDVYIDFIRNHQEYGYILRSYRHVYSDGSTQDFRYYKEDRVFPAGDDTYIEMFDRSIFLSGFTIKSEPAKRFHTDKLDGSLLYQLYLLAEVCRIYPSAYCHTIITQSYEGGTPFFGDSKVEKELYQSGINPIENSINFMRWYNVVIDLIAEKYHNDTNIRLRHYMSKYSYGYLKSQRKAGLKTFNEYARQLRKMGFGASPYFYVYYIALLLLGENRCDKMISILKRIIGHRPQL